MTAKEYLSQAKILNARINSKTNQLDSIRSLTTRCTSAITGMPRNPSPTSSLMADTVDRIVDLEAEINADIDRLVDIKAEITNTLKQVDDYNLRFILEMRYLYFSSWEEIAAALEVTTSWVFKLHRCALKEVEAVLKRSEVIL